MRLLKILKKSYTVLVLAPLTVSTMAADLTIEVDGLRNAEGAVVIAIYDSKTSFPKKGKAMQRVVVNLSHKSAKAEIANIPEGVYAVALFHDENNNGKFDKSMIGLPQEGYGFSNNARGRMGPPPFEAASLQLTSDSPAFKINVSY